MASDADKRLLELLDKWLTSLELHTKYSALDDDSYWKIQPWIEHQRPSRWLLDLAKQKTAALKAALLERIGAGDATFSESLEEMIFLANLLGSEHIERFIPMAEPKSDVAPAASTSDGSVTATREMPKFAAAPSAAGSSANAQAGRGDRKRGAGAKAVAKGAVKPPLAPPESGAATAGSAHAAREQVIADAVRLVQWGRKWFELPELVARMAGRPPLAEVRRILKENKPAIEAKAKN
jgi:hypothetical protein